MKSVKALRKAADCKAIIEAIVRRLYGLQRGIRRAGL